MSDYLDYLRELLSPLGTIRAKRMFGGWGLYGNERFFAIVAEDRLYVKVDALSEPEFRAAGCEPFVFTAQGKSVAMAYWSLPDEAFDSPEDMQPWARRAYDAACRAAEAKAA
ncbi:MAG TPA: TfoX/Sxy family protein, partial [Arenimonas sp.]|nr:TfoX/Sxy family protein [Arenimonas sp.]